MWVFDPAAQKVALRPVVIAQYREDGVVVGSGLAAGEWVVGAGANKLHEGQMVRPYEAAGRPSPPVASTAGLTAQRVAHDPARLRPAACPARASTCPSGRSTIARSCSISSSCSRSPACSRTSKLGQSEDPPFTFKVMVVKTNWPGASAREVEQQVTDRIESKLQEVPHVDWVRSYSKPGESLVFVSFKDSLPSASRCPRPGTRCARRSATSATRCPPGIQGPFFNDEFGDTYANIYAITGDGFGYRELKEFGDRVRAELLRVPGVAKVDFIGEQDEKIYVELVERASSRRSASSPAQIVADARRAERGRGGRRVRHGDRPHLPAPHRRVRLARRDPRHRDPRQQPPVPAGRHRRRLARLRRPAAAEDALARAARRSASASRWRRAAT